MNAGELAALAGEQDRHLPVWVHVGWDWPIEETDVGEDGLILFVETPACVGFVNQEGLDSMQASATHRARRLMLAEKLLRRWVTPERDMSGADQDEFGLHLHDETERFLDG